MVLELLTIEYIWLYSRPRVYGLRRAIQFQDPVQRLLAQQPPRPQRLQPQVRTVGDPDKYTQDQVGNEQLVIEELVTTMSWFTTCPLVDRKARASLATRPTD